MPAGSVRIIGGRWRGSKIRVADAEALRPTPDRVRETLFNWIGARIDGARCLDLFAGTGALGLEALSRGARRVVFVERDRGLCDDIAANVRRLDAEGRIELRCFVAGNQHDEAPRNDTEQQDGDGIRVEIHCADVQEWARRENNPISGYDLVFMDPPYQSDLLQATLNQIGERLPPFAGIYIESDQPLDELKLPRPMFRCEKAGNVHYALLGMQRILQGGR